MDKRQTECNGINDFSGRREFFRRAGSLLAGAALTGGTSFENLFSGSGVTEGIQARSGAGNQPLLVNGLPGSRLGKTGLEVTKIGFGGMLVNEPTVLLHALDSGINLIHTAPEYQNGASLTAFGKVLKEHRQRVIVAVNERPGAIDRILPVLNTDHVDIILPPLHSPASLNDSGLFEDFQKARDAGKCRFLGFTCHSEVTAVLEKAAEKNIFDVAMVSYMNTDDPWFFRSLRLARQAGMGVLAMSPIPIRSYRSEDINQEETVLERYGDILNRWYAHSVMTTMNNYQSVDFYTRLLDGNIVSRRSRSAIRG